jgi:hypothetical protein
VVLDKTAPGQSADQEKNFLVDVAAAGCERAQCQARAQALSAFGRLSAECPQAERNIVKAGGDRSAGVRLQRDVT